MPRSPNWRNTSFGRGHRRHATRRLSYADLAGCRRKKLGRSAWVRTSGHDYPWKRRKDFAPSANDGHRLGRAQAAASRGPCMALSHRQEKNVPPPIRITEVGPRDGLQNEPTILSTESKI